MCLVPYEKFSWKKKRFNDGRDEQISLEQRQVVFNKFASLEAFTIDKNRQFLR